MAVTKNLVKRQGSKDKDKWILTEIWEAFSTSGDDQTDVIDDFPLIFSTGYTSAYLTSINVDEVEQTSDGGSKWTCTIVYDTSVDQPSGGASEDPLDLDPVYSYDYEDIEEIVDYTYDGDKVVNRLGENFDPPLYRTVSYPVMNVAINKASIDFATLFALNNSTNSDTFHGATAHTLRCKASAKEAKDSEGTVYYQVVYKFVYRAKGWDANIPNMSVNGAGNWEGSPAGYPTWEANTRILDKAGEAVTEPQFLNASNEPLVKPVDPEDIDILTFEIYPELNFGTATGV